MPPIETEFQEGDRVRVRLDYFHRANRHFGDAYRWETGRVTDVYSYSNSPCVIVDWDGGVYGWMAEPEALELDTRDGETHEMMYTCWGCFENFSASQLQFDIHNHAICPTCLPNFAQCADCGQWTRRRDNDEEPLCRGCRNRRHQQVTCVGCQNIFEPDQLRRDERGCGLCQTCQDSDEYFVCDSCGYWNHDNNYGRDGLCDSCYEDRYDRDEDECYDGHIYEYHAGKYKTLTFLPEYKNNDLYLGVELETDRYDNRYNASDALYQLSDYENLFWQECDASLANGIEIISCPATLKYHEKQFPWSKIMETCANYGAKSHNTTTCGLHVHFSTNFFGSTEAEIEVNTAKLLYFFERFWTKLTKLSRRSQANIREYARRYREPLEYDKPRETARKAKAMASHYYAVNLENDNTIEIRIFRGTLKLDTFLADLEFIDFMARLIKRSTVSYLQQLSWEKMCKRIPTKKYANLINHLKERELYVPDNS